MRKILIAVVFSLFLSACASIKRIADNVILWEKPYTLNDVKGCGELMWGQDGNPITGKVNLYYENGNLKEEAPFKNGKQEGLAKFYYENGDLAKEITFKDGKAVSGYLYDEAGKKTKMTNAHLHNLIKGSY